MLTFVCVLGNIGDDRLGGWFQMRAHFLVSMLLLGGETAAPALSGQATASAAAEQPQTIAEQMDAGQNQLDAHRYEQAIEVFNRVLVRIPDFGPALAQRALAEAWTNRMEEATRDIDAAARSMPDNVLLHTVRATIAQRRSDDATAIVEYTRALTLEPGNRHALRVRASLYRDAGNNAAAVADAETYIDSHPEEIDGYVMKATLLIGQRDRVGAAAEADRIMRTFPDDPEFLFGAATIYHRLADRTHALAAMDRAVARRPNSFALLLSRAQFRRWDDFVGWRADLDAALAIEPGHGDILTQLALLDFKERKWAAAVARFTQVLVQEPRDYGVLAYRTMAHLNAGERALAEQDFRAALAASEGADDFGLICGSFAREGFALDWALDTCNRALGLKPEDPAHHASRGLVELRLGRLDAALADYDAAIAADARRAGSYYGRALVHHRRGEAQAAVADRAEALAIDPGIAETFQSYGFTDF
ncbi:tetratricopeptide repeat protein [Allosphingosinicella sp.]|uniref:tetratricopeptide repeat protein n=1 Tax=Allosphingosinicella sp. TaxID=2823234 RepID=UPI0037834709